MSLQKQPRKVELIDRKTYEALQQQGSSNSNNPLRPIRNAKYKKTRTVVGSSANGAINLLQFLTQKPKERQSLKKKRQRGVRVLANRIKEPWKKRGKTREGGKRKKRSRLKKSILCYRQLKRERSQQQKEVSLIEDTVERLRELQIGETVQLGASIKPQSTVHSRKFRAYCNNCTTPVLGQLVDQFLRELNRFQKRAYAQNEIKARAHRRFVVGFREVQNFLRINKVKLVIIAPDCEECSGEAGIDEIINNMKTHCQNQNIPYLFALRRRQLAYALFKKVPVSCVAVLDYDGAREIFTKILEALKDARQDYEALQARNTSIENEPPNSAT